METPAGAPPTSLTDRKLERKYRRRGKNCSWASKLGAAVKDSQWEGKKTSLGTTLTERRKDSMGKYSTEERSSRQKVESLNGRR